ncbi:MAG: DUF4352 domain-containing protein [Schwartzia succinivorans]|uniref:DUF4352 domain-containing protein n=1 Tax=Schwartzia succinivorans TaxID=55507 RepID=UPI002357B4E4|nr:DUF4352 domain-containing protein [Schwartzia succinivorans]MBE6097927.1 DUF4352 domain-containing protein [Schwartzia succinivorans]
MRVRKFCWLVFFVTLAYLAGFKMGIWGVDNKNSDNQQITKTSESSSKDKKKTSNDRVMKVSENKAESKERSEPRSDNTANNNEKESEPINYSRKSGLSGTVESVTRPRSLTGPMGTVQGPFALINLTIVNRSSNAVSIVGYGIKLIDKQGRSYSLSNAAMGTLFHLREDTFHMTDIQPGMSKTAYVVFAMPADAVPHKLHIQPHGFGPSFEVEI